MTLKFKYGVSGGGYTGVVSTSAPGAISSQTVITQLFDNGVLHNAFGDISGYQYVNFPTASFSGDSTTDELLLDGGSDHTMLVWDERTAVQLPNSFNLYSSTQPNGLGHTSPAVDADGRYGLPGGGSDQTTAIDIIRVATGAGHNLDNNLINLGYSSAYGGIAYNTQVTFYGGPGRDLFIGGENRDLVYGGDEHNGIGEGLWGGGGDDTIYAGANLGNTVDPSGSPNTGADDLFGYSGNDVLYGANDGDVYYGDAGADVIYGAGFSGIGTIGSGYNGDSVTFFGGDGDDTLYASANVGSNGLTSTKEFFFGGNSGVNWNDKNFVQNSNGADNGTMDVVSYQNAATSVVVNLNGAVAYAADVNGQAVPNGTLLGTGAGGAVNDVFFGIEGVIGGTQGDRLTGNAVANFFSGLGGNDTLFGGDANDTLWGGLGVDTLFGGNNDDILDGNGGGDSVFGDAGNDTIAYANDIAIDGAGANDSVLFNNSETTLNIVITTASTTGSDLLDGGANTDSLTLTSGNDVLVVNSNDLTINGVVGANVPGKIAAFEVVDGGAGDDIIALNDAGGAVYNQDVTVAGGTGLDLIATGSGNDTIFGGALGDTAVNTANGGADTLYGGAGNDLIYGTLNNDTISGGVGGDTIFSGTGSDLILARGDTIAAGTTTGWDTANGASTPVSVAGKYQALDTITAGLGIDTLRLDDSVNNPGVGAYYNAYLGGATLRLSGIDIITATALADVINLTNGSSAAYATDVSVFAGNGSDFVFSGSGNDVVVGDSTSGGVGSDTLFGGDGNDTIFGDLQNTLSDFGAADSLNGGDGNDTIFGGLGDDRISDIDTTVRVTDTSIDGGAGADIISVTFRSATAIGIVNGGANAAGDGADAVTTSGSYQSVTSNLGLGDDNFLGSSNGSGGIDTVHGEDGNDVISSWLANDVLFGDNGNDVLWGGAGSDTIYGGTGTDYLYPGDGPNNVMYGGASTDFYYVTRTDGANNQIFDTGVNENYLVVIPTADPTEVGPGADWLKDGAGVFEVDHDLMDNAGGNDMVRVVYNGGTSYTLSVLTGDGGGVTTINFDGNDINQIVLWNNGGTTTGHTFQIYQYNSVAHTYDFLSEF